MLSIIVLEDDALQRHRVSRLLDEAVEESKAVVDGITFYEQGQELLDADRGSGKSMVYLLDIDLKNQTKQGLDIGLEIRKEDLKAQIAFVTAYSEFMPLTFRYKIQALDFVDKSMDDVDLKRALVELLDFAQSQVEQETKAQSLTVKTDKNDVNLPYEDLYIETAPVPHKLIAHTKLNLVEFYGKIAEVAKLDDIFFQTHRSFVVNVSNVASVDRTANMVFFEGDESCLLSRTRKKEFLERLKNR